MRRGPPPHERAHRRRQEIRARCADACARAVSGKGSQYSGADNQYVKARMKKADFNKKEWVQVTSPRLACGAITICVRDSTADRLSWSNRQIDTLTVFLSGTLPAHRRLLSGGE